jgi:hypothetical protein
MKTTIKSIGRGVPFATVIAIAEWRAADPATRGTYPGPPPRGRGPGRGADGRDVVALPTRSKALPRRAHRKTRPS